MLVVGLTGGIGSGKSTVANYFADLKIPVIDTDVIARELVEPGQTALNEIVDTFGREVLTESGKLDRKHLADITFNNSQKLKQLEAILHPKIREEMLARLTSLNAPYAIVVIPLLLETGQQNLVDRILVVDCAENSQIERVQERDQRTVQQIQAIIKKQTDRKEKLKAADDIITNTGSTQDLMEQVAQIHEKYLKIATS